MEIQDKVCYVVINANTMERVSKFYSRKADAKTFITNRTKHTSEWYKQPEFAIAEFVYQTHYKLEN